MSYANNIATKGILGGVPGTKGFILVSIQEIPMVRYKGGYSHDLGLPQKRLKKVRINYIYNGSSYVEEKIVDYNTTITLNNLDMQVIDNKPMIKIII